MDRYAAIGQPVNHSRSPRIHAMFATAAHHTLTYERIEPAQDEFEAAVALFRAQGGCGLNVTLPFKERAYALADQSSIRARAAGAANTLMFSSKGVFADNTDGAGLVRDLRLNLGVTLKGARILLLGAGGAARGVVGPLLDQEPALLVIANRTAARALQLREALQASGAITPLWLSRCQACGLEEIPKGVFDVVINATSSSLDGSVPNIPPSVFGPHTVAYDMVYAQSTPFIEMAHNLGSLRAVDGLGMLVEQAAESFHLWRGIYPDTAAVLRQLRAESV